MAKGNEQKGTFWLHLLPDFLKQILWGCLLNGINEDRQISIFTFKITIIPFSEQLWPNLTSSAPFLSSDLAFHGRALPSFPASFAFSFMLHF